MNKKVKQIVKKEETTNIITLENKKTKNYKKTLKEINENNEIAKAIWQTDNIEEAIQEEIDNKEQLDKEIEKIRQQEKKYNFFEPIIIFTFLILSFLGMYILLFTQSNAIINTLFNSLSNKINETIDTLNTYQSFLNKGINIKTTISTTNENYKYLENYTYHFNLSNKDNIYSGQFQINSLSNNLTLDYTYNNNTIYLKSPMYYYPIHINIPNNINPLTIEYNNIKKDISTIKKYILEEIKDIKNKKSKEIINNTKLNVLTISFSREEITQITKNILNKIINDTKLINSIANTLCINEQTITNFLKQEISFNTNYSLKIYTKGILQEFKGFSIYKEDKKLLEYLKLDNKTLKLYTKENTYSIHTSNDKILFYYNNIKILDIKIDKQKEIIKTEFQINTILNNYRGSLYIQPIDEKNTYIIFSLKDTNNPNNNIAFNIDIKKENQNNYSFDTTDSVDIKNITQEEKIEIINELKKILLITK